MMKKDEHRRARKSKVDFQRTGAWQETWVSGLQGKDEVYMEIYKVSGSPGALAELFPESGSTLAAISG